MLCSLNAILKTTYWSIPLKNRLCLPWTMCMLTNLKEGCCTRLPGPWTWLDSWILHAAWNGPDLNQLTINVWHRLWRLISFSNYISFFAFCVQWLWDYEFFCFLFSYGFQLGPNSRLDYIVNYTWVPQVFNQGPLIRFLYRKGRVVISCCSGLPWCLSNIALRYNRTPLKKGHEPLASCLAQNAKPSWRGSDNEHGYGYLVVEFA